ncbi:type IV secretion system protein [Pectobacterium carotovorum]|uniref:ATPase, T2SS/T4P/T4SS family n=1 Tax=Pectobacterium versatile TaxID=2488639 RepID=UPI000C7EC7C7|nr:ATPase, T2SS/T4P/T4SS family [Pectobacterium versatile]PLY35842.1 type IV secretion system protein [Pectobacterium carotovorum]
MASLSDSEFVDIYVGEGYTDIKGLKGASNLLVPAPPDLLDDINALKFECVKKHEETKRREFNIHFKDVLYRITVSNDAYDHPVIFIRRTKNSILPIDNLAISDEIKTMLANPKINGLFLVTGDMAVGKTTSAASFMAYRTDQTGSITVALEDPIETALGGPHGSGRGIQFEVDEYEGYAGALKRALRMGVPNLFVGEIRDSETAYEVLKMSLNGTFVCATLHGVSVIDAIDRFSILCTEKNSQSNPMIAKALCGISHQKLQPNYRNGKDNIKELRGYDVSISAYKLISNEIDTILQSVKLKIAHGNFSTLVDDFNALAQRSINDY